jgi:DNA-binding transcriptional MerR regulator
MKKERYWIGDVAKKLGLSLRTIRYYEELGILKPRGRTAGHFRLYAEDDVKRLEAVQSLKSLGYSLKQIQDVMRATSHSKTGNELVSTILKDLGVQEALAKEQLRHYRETLKSIGMASQLLGKCLGCKKKPNKSNCLTCKVFSSEDEVPLLFRAAFA